MPQRNFLVLTQTILSATVRKRRQIKFVHNTFHLTHQVLELYSKLHQEFPGGLVVRIPGFHYHGPGLYPDQATEILKAVQCGQKEKKITATEYIYYRIDQQYRPYPLQYSCLENPMDGGAWQAAVHGVAKSRARLSDFTFTFHCHALEKEMATRSSVLAWRIPGTGEPGGLPSMGSHRVGHD